MAKDDIFRIIYIILKELYENKKDGKRTPKEHISAERFNIPDSGGHRVGTSHDSWFGSKNTEFDD